MATATQTPSLNPSVDPFEMTVPAPSGADFEVCPQGNHIGNIVALYDVGTQEDENDKGEKRDVRKMVVCFELQKNKKDGKHFVLAKSYTMSMSDKSNWYKLVTGLMAKRFREGEKFNARSMLGTPCMVLVTNETKTKDGKENTYDKVETVSQFPEGLPTPTAYRPPVVWSVMTDKILPDTSWVPNIYGKSVKKLVEESKEFASGLIGFEPPSEAPATNAKGDEIPF